ncbi:metallophosphoesterase [Salipaludibacillus sp. CUR1]|uniref:metallophosphoesterase n=1 Tax=Salipaludibacillus sp. CUR1 TaxID=2820003 RepID=UPI001E3EC10E|nr:metallophosphoesterase [Salipaludibacillus sp. CUR1]MCE7792754.1 metallophosphoesterase [Salipaludibacillus sp. CUR1]
MRKKRGSVLVIIMLLFITVVVSFTIWDNNRIILAEQDIEIEGLPSELEGFRILQVTDLHEKYFGENQSRLSDKINGIDYDVIVFTGDMLETGNTTDFHPFYSLIDGITNKDHALFVHGNSDPEPYRYGRHTPFERHEFINGMEDKGVTLLESVYTVEVGSAHVHFTEFELSLVEPGKGLAEIDQQAKIEQSEHYQDYLNHQKDLLEEMQVLDEASQEDVLISLYHYPIVDFRVDLLMDDPDSLLRDFDLMLAGHYHGGQIRLPFVGAPFVPEPYYERSGLFPPQDRIKGLWEYRGLKQYVSAGLGSSDALPLLNFRFLNPPEINLLTLKSK